MIHEKNHGDDNDDDRNKMNREKYLLMSHESCLMMNSIHGSVYPLRMNLIIHLMILIHVVECLLKTMMNVKTLPMNSTSLLIEMYHWKSHLTRRSCQILNSSDGSGFHPKTRTMNLKNDGMRIHGHGYLLKRTLMSEKRLVMMYHRMKGMMNQ